MNNTKCSFVKTCWYILIIILGFYFVSLLYPDIVITYHHSLNFLDCLFSGNLIGFYDYSVQNQYGGWPANYSLPMYIVFGIWCLPIWLLGKLSIISVESVWCLLFIKGLVLFCCIGCVFLLKKILINIDCKDIKLSLFQFSSSLLFIIPALAIVQYDVISLMFTLLAIYLYIKEERFSFKFFFIFSVAVALKLFAIFPFIYLILLKEKRIFYIIRNILFAFAVYIIVALLYFNNAGYKTAVVDFNSGMLDRLMNVTFETGTLNISIFFSLFFVICIIAYLSNPARISETIYMLSWLCTFFYLDLFLFMQFAHPYWIILMVPFLFIMISLNKKKMKINFTLEILLELSIIIVYASIFYWVMLNNTSFSYLLFKNIPVYSNILQIDSFSQIVDLVNLRNLLPIFYSLFAVVSGALLFINWPGYKKDASLEIVNENVITKEWLYIIRIICLIVYFTMSIVIYYII